jgi:hypothetical protein
MPRMAFVIPTHDRTKELAQTLGALDRLDHAALAEAGGAEVVIASADEVDAPARTRGGLPIRRVTTRVNNPCVGRNTAAEATSAEWLVMLDDDSEPLCAGFVHALADAPMDVSAVSADVTLPNGAREQGGLPEVFVGCGVAMRAESYRAAGGYDPDFFFYAEEYDLAARLIAMGTRVRFDPRFRVLHRKTGAGRDMNEIMRRITRNSAWVELRYAPNDDRDEAVEHVLKRYQAIAVRERALPGFERGARELASTLCEQPRRAMDTFAYERFTGLAHARAAVRASADTLAGARVALVHRGKNDWAIEHALAELGLTHVGTDIVAHPTMATAHMVGTLSPGPMLDALQCPHGGQPLLAPWVPGLDPVRGVRECGVAWAA